MNDTSLANKYRPRTFEEVVGQTSEMEVLKKAITGKWKPNALIITGPFGTGKTTSARLISRALLCSNLQLPVGETGETYEPCGECEDCKSMDRENHPNYLEVDAASNGSVGDVRGMLSDLEYRTGNKLRIVCYDESHMLSVAAQNTLLQTLETGSHSILFIFATTESNKMLPTVKSRAVELNMKLLAKADIQRRLIQVCKEEGLDYDPKALGIIATHVRGHARDALMMLEQISRISPTIDQDTVRTYLRLDQDTEVYKMLVEQDTAKGLTMLEQLLCNYSANQMADIVGKALLNAYKLHNGVCDESEIDKAYYQKILEARGPDSLLDTAEAVMRLNTNMSTINQAIASFANILLEGKVSRGGKGSLRPGSKPAAQAAPNPMAGGFRKPGK